MRATPASVSGGAPDGRASNIGRRYLSQVEVSEYSGISPRTLEGWRLRGIGPRFRRLGSAVRYDVRDVDAWVAAQPGGGAQK